MGARIGQQSAIAARKNSDDIWLARRAADMTHDAEYCTLNEMTTFKQPKLGQSVSTW